MNIPEALAATKAAYDLVALGVAARDEAKVNSALVDLQARLLDALVIATTHVQSMNTLELEVQKLRMEAIEADARQAELERQIKQRSQYKLTEVAPGKLVRELVESTEGQVGNPKYFCATCYGEGREIPLQFHPKPLTGGPKIECPSNDKHSIYLARESAPLLYPNIGIV